MLTITSKIDLPILVRQKRAILRAIRKANKHDAQLLDGVLNLLDHIHDTMDPPNMMRERQEPADPLDPVWAEYDSAADYCARRWPAKWQFCLPPNISLKCINEINYDEEAFERRVKDCAYARAMEKTIPR